MTAVQDPVVAEQMQVFFKLLKRAVRQDPQLVAESYVNFVDQAPVRVLLESKSSRESKFYIGLSTDLNLELVTKRAVLVCDTLLLTHARDAPIVWLNDSRISPKYISYDNHKQIERKGFTCQDPVLLGQWILDSEPLLKAGLTWYYPRVLSEQLMMPEVKKRFKLMTLSGVLRNASGGWSVGAVPRMKVEDYLLHDGRAVDVSGAKPVAGAVVRRVLEIDLPFIDGVGLREFSRITIDEFAAYAPFRDFLRQRLLALDDGLNAVQSERELARIGLEIKDGIRDIHSRMRLAGRRRAIGVTGAVVGTVGAVLVAVYGPALAEAVAIAGASGGIWQIIQGIAENSPRVLREDRWHYVWVLSRRSNTI